MLKIKNVDQSVFPEDGQNNRREIFFSEKVRPMNEILLSRLKESLQDAIDYQKENKTNSISTDFQLNQLIDCLLKNDNQNFLLQD